MELLLGAGGGQYIKKLSIPGCETWSELVTLDINPDHKPDVVWDLTKRPLPFPDNHFSEIHAYEVLEHLGQQGDWRAFFDEWSEWWRILKPGGYFFGTCPHWSSPWVWGDPGHTRVVSGESFIFLSQPNYDKQVGTTAMTDYRFVYKADFDCAWAEVRGEVFMFTMEAIKPSRCTK